MAGGVDGSKVEVRVGSGVRVKVGSRVSITIWSESSQGIKPHPNELSAKIITVAKIDSDKRRRTACAGTGRLDNLDTSYGMITSPPTDASYFIINEPHNNDRTVFCRLDCRGLAADLCNLD
jgi:hypothetical protein